MRFSKEIQKSYLKFAILLSSILLLTACNHQKVVKLPVIQPSYDYDWFQLDSKDISTVGICFPKIFLSGLLYLQSDYPNARYKIEYSDIRDKVRSGTFQPICDTPDAKFVEKVCMIEDNGGNPHNICVQN